MRNNGDDHENRPIGYGLTAKDRARLLELHFELGEQREAEANLALVQAVQLGEAFQRLKGG